MRFFGPALFCVLIVAPSTLAEAHVSIVSGPAASAKSQKITFGVGHGCEGADTIKLRVEIPPGISGVRPLASDFGKPKVDTEGANVTAIIWEKPAGDLQATDVQYYELTLRARVDAPAFSTVLFRVFQTCRPAGGAADGSDDIVVPWIAGPGEPGEPAAALVVAPARIPGWNKFVVGPTTTISAANLPVYLGDALIVWRDSAAFSSNANTMAMVATTPGVTALTGDLRPNDVLWVKY